MKKSVLYTVAILVSTSILLGCGGEKKVDTQEDFRLEVTTEEKTSYIDIANDAVEGLADATDDIKKEAKVKSVYDAVLDREGRELMKTISITREEAIVELNKNLRPKLYKIIEMDIPCEDDGHSHEEGQDFEHNIYYVYEGDTSFDGVDLSTVFKDAKNIEYKDATYEDNIEEVKRSLASEELVKLIDSKVEKVLS